MRPGRARGAAVAVAAAVAAVALGACADDTLRLALEISGGPAQACPSTAPLAAPSCSDVQLQCDAVLSLRVVRPRAPEQTYLPLCQPIPRNASGDLCALEQIDLPARALPKETLEVQVMIWPREVVKEDPATGVLDCSVIDGQPVAVGFTVDGFPAEVAPAPALGGRAFYHPGDALTVVTLGCSDLAAVNRPACAGQIELRAGVTELDDPLSPVTSARAEDLSVMVGEPRYDASRGEHLWQPIKALDLQPPTPGRSPEWSGAVDALDTRGTLCVRVTDGRSSSTVRCGRIDPAARVLDLTGTWLSGSRLSQILAGLTGTSGGEVPPEGLTIGIVIDDRGRPAKDYQIATSPSTVSGVKYVDKEGSMVDTTATATTDSGLFVSLEAPYDADFRALQGGKERASGIGGRVRGAVTVTVLQLGR